MRYELGDKVKIKAHWRKANYSKQLEDRGIEFYENSLEDYLGSDDMAGDYIRLLKHEKVNIDEIGLIVGTRQIKTEYDLMMEYHGYVGDGRYNELDEPYIYQENSKHEKIYLVATRMNCLRKVSFEDIEYIYEG